MKSWRKHCPGYAFIEWNETNVDIAAAPLYVQQAYEHKMWAFVSDYVRLQVVHEHGGIYLDTDVELKASLEPLLTHRAYFGFEDGRRINTGLGFAAEACHPILVELMSDYTNTPFVKPGGDLDLMPCPRRNTSVFLRHGMRQDDSMQILDDDILILPTTYLCPVTWKGDRRYSPHTISVHHHAASWLPASERRRLIILRLRRRLRTAVAAIERRFPSPSRQPPPEHARRGGADGN